MKTIKWLLVVSVFILMSLSVTRAQTPSPTPQSQDCSGAVYKGTEVDRKVKVLTYPSPHFDDREMQEHSGSVIVLRAIFCGSGKVTDIKVQRGASANLDREAVNTAKTIKFHPAEKSGEKVSQWMTLEYQIND